MAALLLSSSDVLILVATVSNHLLIQFVYCKGIGLYPNDCKRIATQFGNQEHAIPVPPPTIHYDCNFAEFFIFPPDINTWHHNNYPKILAWMSLSVNLNCIHLIHFWKDLQSNDWCLQHCKFTVTTLETTIDGKHSLRLHSTDPNHTFCALASVVRIIKRVHHNQYF